MTSLSKDRTGDLAPPESRARELAAIEHEVAEHFRVLKRGAMTYARSKINSLEEAEEVVAGAFADLWTACAGVGSADAKLVRPTKGLFFTILRRRIIDWYRRKADAPRRVALAGADPMVPSGEVLPVPVQLMSVQRTGETELQARIHAALRRLPEDRRRVVLAAMENDWNARHVADHLGMKHSTVRTILQDSRRYLGESLARDGFSVPGFGREREEIQ